MTEIGSGRQAYGGGDERSNEDSLESHPMFLIMVDRAKK
jgi:hypothetical protein